MGLFTLGAHRIRGRGVGSSLGPLFFLPLFTNVVEEEFSEVVRYPACKHYAQKVALHHACYSGGLC